MWYNSPATNLLDEQAYVGDPASGNGNNSIATGWEVRQRGAEGALALHTGLRGTAACSTAAAL